MNFINFSYECICAAYPLTKSVEDYVKKQADQMQAAAERIGASGRYDTKDDFTVVFQPFFNDTYLPRKVT